MKKLVSILVCLILILAISVTAFAAYGPGPGGTSTMLKTTTNVNFRSGPGTNYDSYGLLLAGEIFWLSSTSNYPWYAGYADPYTDLYRLIGEREGYVHSQYLTVP